MLRLQQRFFHNVRSVWMGEWGRFKLLDLQHSKWEIVFAICVVVYVEGFSANLAHIVVATWRRTSGPSTATSTLILVSRRKLSRPRRRSRPRGAVGEEGGGGAEEEEEVGRGSRRGR